MQATKIKSELTIAAVLWSFEDVDSNRYFPLGENRYAVRDGGNGAELGIVQLTVRECDELIGEAAAHIADAVGS
jgi:hypothetical protein